MGLIAVYEINDNNEIRPKENYNPNFIPDIFRCIPDKGFFFKFRGKIDLDDNYAILPEHWDKNTVNAEKLDAVVQLAFIKAINTGKIFKYSKKQILGSVSSFDRLVLTSADFMAIYTMVLRNLEFIVNKTKSVSICRLDNDVNVRPYLFLTNTHCTNNVFFALEDNLKFFFSEGEESTDVFIIPDKKDAKGIICEIEHYKHALKNGLIFDLNKSEMINYLNNMFGGNGFMSDSVFDYLVKLKDDIVSNKNNSTVVTKEININTNTSSSLGAVVEKTIESMTKFKSKNPGDLIAAINEVKQLRDTCDGFLKEAEGISAIDNLSKQELIGIIAIMRDFNKMDQVEKSTAIKTWRDNYKVSFDVADKIINYFGL